MGENATVGEVFDGWSGQEANTYSLKCLRKSEGQLLGGYVRVHQDQEGKDRLERDPVTGGPYYNFSFLSSSIHLCS